MTNKTKLLLSCLCMTLTFGAVSVSAQQSPLKINQEEEEDDGLEWERHQSITGVFETKFPKQYKYKLFPLQFSPDSLAFSSEVVSRLDNDQETLKSILIKTTQTFGAEMSAKRVKNILTREGEKYKELARNMKGKLLTNEDFDHQGFHGKKLYISHTVDGKKHGLRINVYMTNFSKVEQVLSGPSEAMYSYSADNFFDSIILYDGRISGDKHPLGTGWKEYKSSQGIFTALFPPKNSAYTPKNPALKTKKNSESMHFELNDPVLNEKIFYSVNSYKYNKDVDLQTAKNVLFSNHVSKFVENASIDSLKTENYALDGVKYMKTKLIISPPKNIPYINTIFLEARYIGDTVVIQELLSNPSHAKSGIQTTLFSLLKFHPKQYKTAQ